MALSQERKFQQNIIPSSWKVETLRDFLWQHGPPLEGKKSGLVTKVKDYIKAKELEHELDAVVFKQLHVQAAADFCELPDSNWTTSGFPNVAEWTVGIYI